MHDDVAEKHDKDIGRVGILIFHEYKKYLTGGLGKAYLCQSPEPADQRSSSIGEPPDVLHGVTLPLTGDHSLAQLGK